MQGIQRAHQLAHELAILNFRLRLGQFCVECDVGVVGAPSGGFLPNALKTIFRLSRVFLDL